MNQSAAVVLEHTVVQFEFPHPNEKLLDSVRWGAVDAFPTPAYWAYQVLARRVAGTTIRYRLGETLAEEVSACLLGGHGIPAQVAIAAFRSLKSKGLLSGTPSETRLRLALLKPIDMDGRSVHYRFAERKSKYLAFALASLAAGPAPTESGHALRNWLLPIPGIGLKTASWIARNWLHADDVAIIDIHIMRAGALTGFFNPRLTVTRDYLELEDRFVRFSRALGVRPSELDAVIWHEMMSSRATVRELWPMATSTRAKRRSRPRTHEGRPNPGQTRLID